MRHWPPAGMVCAGSGPNPQIELHGSGCPTGFPDPDPSIIRPCGSSSSHTPRPGAIFWPAVLSTGRQQWVRIPVNVLPDSNRPNHPRHLVGEGNGDQHSRLAVFEPIKPRAFADRSASEPVRARHGPNDQQASDITLACFRYPSQTLLAARRMLSRERGPERAPNQAAKSRSRRNVDRSGAKAVIGPTPGPSAP